LLPGVSLQPLPFNRIFRVSDRIIRIGVLGCANIAWKSVIPAIKSLDTRFELKYIASRSHEKAEKFSKEFHCLPILGYDSMIEATDLDALYIPLPTGLHKEWINKALRSGKHVYAEKSIAQSFQDAREFVNNARTRELGLMEGFMFLYHTQHKKVFSLLNDGVIGEPRHFFSSFGFPPLPQNNFRYSEALGGGAILDAAAYTIRAAHFIMGPDLEVKAATMFDDIAKGTNIYGSAFLSDSHGLGASVAFGFDNFYQCCYKIWGAKGKIIAKRAFTPPDNLSPAIIVENSSGIITVLSEPDNHFVHAFEEFHRVIENSQLREKHYEDILLQSRSLDLVRIHSKK
jgi:NDP-hexose-3-ketoreductase